MADTSGQPGRPRKELSEYPPVMSLEDYCEYYGISKATARAWIEEGRATRLPGIRHFKILRESVRQYEERLLGQSPE